MICRRDFRWAKVKNEAVDWPTNDESETRTLSGYSVDDEDIEFQPIKWDQVIVAPSGDHKWHVSIPPSHAGFRAVFIEISFPGSDNFSKLTFTTEVIITPDSRPFPPCTPGDQCYGFLL